MLIETILNALQRVFFGLFDAVNLPPLPEEIVNALHWVSEILGYAQNLISLFLPWKIVTIGLPIVLAVEAFCMLYQLVMWVIKEIPMASMN